MKRSKGNVSFPAWPGEKGGRRPKERLQTRHRAAVIYELITAFQPTGKLRSVFPISA